MVDVTLLEVDLEGAEFTANAPFSGKEGKSVSGGKVSKLLKRSPGSSSKSSSESSSKPSLGSSSSSSGTSLLSGGDDDSSSGVEIDVTEGEKSPTSAVPVLFLGALAVMFVVFRRLRRRKSGGQQQELVEYEA